MTVGADEDVLVEEVWIPRHEVTHDVDIVAPDRIRELHRVHEARPAPCSIASRQHEPGISELRIRWVDRGGMGYLIV